MKSEQGRSRSGGHRERELFFGAERRGRTATTAADREEIGAWLSGNLVDGWFEASPEVTIDDYEILIVGTVAAPEQSSGDESTQSIAENARIDRFREDTRERRIEIARAAEQRFARKVSWGTRVGSTTVLFTTANVPVMTRLQLAQRRTLDTLVEAGVARSRSEALAWCVELVGANEQEWIARLRTALDTVEEARSKGPGATS